jgi:small-conductance mechanosensitive channel
MRSTGALVVGTSFFQKYSHQLTAVLALVLTFVFAFLADRALSRWATHADLNPAVDTRVRFLRRLVTLAICVVGVLFALSEFAGLHRLAAGLLASSAIIAAIVGFAARQTLANLIAGVMLTIAQPLRIGDQVKIRDDGGVVEDVRLNYTVLRTAAGRRLLIPNERLASELLENDTIVDERVRPEVSVWLPLGADTEAAVRSLVGIEPDLVVRIAEVTVEGVRVAVLAGPVGAADCAAREADLRAAALRTLRDGGLLS